MALIFKIFQPSATFHGVDYNEKKLEQDSASLVHIENFGPLQMGQGSPKKEELSSYLNNWSNRNKRIINPQFHAILSCKGREYTPERLKEVALEMMDKLGYRGIPTLIYAHRDTDNNHVHIVTSRVGVDGKKVEHNFEKKRSNTILNEILKIEPNIKYQDDINKAMSYNYSTTSQLDLLMERKGYTVQEREGIMGFYKYGKQQGTLSKLEIENNKREIPKTGTNKIKALMYRYGATFDSKIEMDKPLVFTTKAKEFSSNLTKELHARFGIEFVFFAGKDKDRPYGYAIIDHKNQTVYKGSDVLKLDLLEGLTKETIKNETINAGQPKEKDWQPINEPKVDRAQKDKDGNEIIDTQEGSGPVGKDGEKNDREPIPMGDIIETAMGLLANIISKDGQLQIDTGKQSSSPKRKRKNSFF